ncbi:hypothetical protein BASA81_005316 [Batrachochytrium salamandrivorans]|nr:hypothetical protein BASA81_005316 [Batrachochytrium salamandrivorans]
MGVIVTTSHQTWICACSQKDQSAHKMSSTMVAATKRKTRAERKVDEEPPKPVEFKAQNTGQGETAFEYVWRVYVVGYASTIVDHLPIPPPKHEKV